MPKLDYKHPDYVSIYRQRADAIKRLNALSTREFASIKAYYLDGHIPDFISDWGMTVNPKNAGTSIPVIMPFILFPRQREWLDFIHRKWKAKEDGLTEKSRDIGISWLAMGYSVSLCVLGKNVAIGFGSAKEENVDASGDPDSLFYKGRMFAQNLPRRFKGDWDIGNKNCTSHMRLLFPATGSTIIGKSGDNIGRGGRTAIFFVDESAHIEHPKLIDASLSANTDCRQDMSSVIGMANAFAEKRNEGKLEVFTFSWRDDPRRDQEWADKKRASLDPVIWSSEYEISYTSSVEGVIIRNEWVVAAINLHKKLGIDPTGADVAALDIADEGRDKNAWAHRKGILLKHVEQWSGVGSDLYQSTARAMLLCDERKLTSFDYDADGMGAGVRGDAKALNDKRTERGPDGRPKGRPVNVHAFRGSESPLFPERIVRGTDRKNEDFFANRKAQAWWSGLRFRFQESFKASQGLPYEADSIISIDGDMAELPRLIIELSQPVYTINNAGKILVEKQPDGTMSPNLADATMMAFAPRKAKFFISDDLLGKI